MSRDATVSRTSVAALQPAIFRLLDPSFYLAFFLAVCLAFCQVHGLHHSLSPPFPNSSLSKAPFQPCYHQGIFQITRFV